jgi:phosphate/sulfate permease
MMANLKTVLTKTTEQFLKGGGQVSPTVKRALRTHRQVQMRTCLGLIIGLIVCASFAIYLLLASPSKGESIMAVIGIGGTGGLLEALRRVWKDWSQTDLLLILIEDATEAQVSSIVDKLVKGL